MYKLNEKCPHEAVGSLDDVTKFSKHTITEYSFKNVSISYMINCNETYV